MVEAKAPHLTPRSLVGQRFGSDVFGDIRVALVGYCPPPSRLERYSPERVSDQHFIHVSPDSVRILTHQGQRFLSLAHVYGGPVSASTVEELAYYGIDVILAYGLAGGLGSKGLRMGDFYLVEDAFAADGTTRHYTGDRLTKADPGLKKLILEQWPGEITPVRAATGDAIYREDDVIARPLPRRGLRHRESRLEPSVRRVSDQRRGTPDADDPMRRDLRRGECRARRGIGEHALDHAVGRR